MRVRQFASGALLLAVSTGVIGVASATDAAAAQCHAITISQGQNLTFNVSSVYVTKGACVRFANLTDVTVTVTVSGSSFSERLPARTPASASASYTAMKSANVTASDGVRTGHGRINVESSGSTAPPAATPTPTSTKSTVVTPPTQSAKPTSSSPTPTSSTAAPSSVSDVPTDAAAAVNTQHPFALPALPTVPVVPQQEGNSSAPPTASHPVVAPRLKSTDPRLTSTVLEPAGGPRRGLPATVAAVLVCGLAAAYGRTVLVAGEAVDRRVVRRPIRPTV